jgi:hypothetical protein
MRKPLHPNVPFSLPNPVDRHCFSTQIPELGVFIIASPIGRAAIFTLRKKRTTEPDSQPQYTYSYQLEYLLPFHEGRDKEVWARATGRLIGVAVGPVQGMFDRSGEKEQGAVRDRRWRLLMYHTDHTVLSFEISKRRVGEEPGLGELVV